MKIFWRLCLTKLVLYSSIRGKPPTPYGRSVPAGFVTRLYFYRFVLTSQHVGLRKLRVIQSAVNGTSLEVAIQLKQKAQDTLTDYSSLGPLPIVN